MQWIILSSTKYKDFQKTWPEIREKSNNIDQLIFFNYDREDYMSGTDFHSRVVIIANDRLALFVNNCIHKKT